MGVLEHIPDDLAAFYGDQYYGLSCDAKLTHGYEDYLYTAEHGVIWAAALIKLLCPSGSVLDIGCANGHLLKKLGSAYKIFGIEANEAMGRIAEVQGVNILGRDLLDPKLRVAHAGNFDVISAIAVFEHLRDIRAGFAAALDMLRNGGFLLFEVPLMSKRCDNTVWFTSSLEHVWYPSEVGLRQLVEGELGYNLIGSEIHVQGYGSTYVGIVVREAPKASQIRAVTARVLTREDDAVSLEERVARMQIGMIHAAATAPADVETLSALSVDAFNPLMLRRISDLWKTDLDRLRLAGEETRSAQIALVQAQTRLQHLESALAALSNNSTRNEIELTREIISLREQLQTARPQKAIGAARADRTSDIALSTSNAVTEVAPNPIAKVPVLGSEIKILDASGIQPNSFAPVEQDWPDDQPLVSVVIPSFNYGELVEEAVELVLAQTFRNLEVIVVEGGSSEGGSRLRVAELDRSRVRVLMQGAGHRAGANRNFGISQARGKYICCLDADDKIRPTYIEKAVFLLERHNFDVVSAALEMCGAQTGVVTILERPDLEELMRGNHVLTCAVFRREFWTQAGGFIDCDPSVTGHVHEDWVFWVRLAALGARFINLALDPMLVYRVHGESLSRRPDVLPMDRQREIVQTLNADLITPEAIDRSRRRAEARLATPMRTLPKVFLNPPAQAIIAEHRPTVLLAMPFLLLGGAERLMSAIAGHLTANGWRVIVLTSLDTKGGHGDTTSWFEQHTCEIFHLPKSFAREFWDDFLRHLIESRRVDILWVVGSAFAYDNLRSLRTLFPQLKVADLLFNTIGHTESNRRRRHQIDVIFVENEEVRGWLLDHGEIGERIRLVESGVDLDRLCPDLRSELFREKITNGSNDIIVAFCGRWSEEKGPLTFIEIARRANRTWPVHFVMTGTGPLKPEVQRAVAAANFPAGRFQLLGEVPDISQVLASVDLLVVPSKLDGRPQVVLEALAAGTPVLASRVGDLPNLVEDGITGWLCEPGAVDEFLQRIAEASANRAELRRKRDSSRASAEARLDARRMFAAYEQGLLSMLPDSNAPASGAVTTVETTAGWAGQCRLSSHD